MAKKNRIEESPIFMWEAESLRFTAFPAPIAPVEEPSWWKDLIGEPPERRMTAPKKGTLQEEGNFDGGRLVLSIQPMRIDWLLTAATRQEEGLETFPTVGPFAETLKTFSALIDRWIQSETFPAVKRVALGTVLLQQVEDKHVAYGRLARYLPKVELDTLNSSDFFYQINRPRASTSGIANLKINRLSKWSVSSWRSALIAVTPGSLEQAAMGPEVFTCRLELDINTAPDSSEPLPREMLPRILQELVNLGEEIARDGDVL